jgi:hypothetical protein
MVLCLRRGEKESAFFFGKELEMPKFVLAAAVSFPKSSHSRPASTKNAGWLARHGKRSSRAPSGHQAYLVPGPLDATASTSRANVRRVLLVEDSAAFRHALATIFESKTDFEAGPRPAR